MSRNNDDFSHYFSVVLPECKVPLKAMLISAGHEKTGDHANYRNSGACAAKRARVIWQYTLAGSGEVFLDGKREKVPPECGMLLVVPGNYVYRIDPDAPYWEFSFVDLVGEEILSLAERCLAEYGAVIPDTPDGALRRLTESIVEGCGEHRYTDEFSASSAAYRMMMGILSVCESHAVPDRGMHDKVLRYCLNNLDRAVSVDEMARAVHLSRWYFSRRFRETEGCSPGEFMLKLRMDQAAKLLQNTLLTVKEVADRCGFAEPSYFCRVFRRYYRVSPAKFRTGT
ncbi:MAG: AraC family transcriptional regulator [Victivallaceae bacterium]|nr:AraC family transcriptional regulator [Victivallaceae bacterium]